MAKYILLFLVFFSLNSYAAEEVDSECLQSFDLDPSKSIDMDDHSLSCSVLEEYRSSLYEILAEGDYEYILDNINRAEQRLDEVQTLLENHSLDDIEEDIHLAEVGVLVSSVGLASCLETAGFGCLLAGGGYILSKYSSYRAGNSREEKIEVIKDLKNDLSKAKEELSRHESKLPEGYDMMVQSFNNDCKVILEQCI